MDTIIGNIRLSKTGDESAKIFVRNHYSYLIEHYYEKYKSYTNKKEVEKIYNMLLEKYYKTENNIHLVLYLHKYLEYLLHKKYEAKEIMVKETIVLACQGDKDARNKLVKYFSKVVLEKAKNYDYMEYDDLVQHGMIKLIEYIDILIEEHKDGAFLVNGIPRAIDIYFDKTLRKQVTRWNTPLGYFNDDLENKKTEMDFNSIIDTLTTNEKRKNILKKYFLGRETYDMIGASVGESRETIRKIVKTYKPGIKINYLK